MPVSIFTTAPAVRRSLSHWPETVAYFVLTVTFPARPCKRAAGNVVADPEFIRNQTVVFYIKESLT